MSDIIRRRGDTRAEEWQVKSRRTGTYIDITGYTAILTVDSREAPTDTSTIIYQLTGAITVAGEGRIEFAPNLTQANAAAAGSYYFDIQLIDGSGRKWTYDFGTWTITQDITKD